VILADLFHDLYSVIGGCLLVPVVTRFIKDLNVVEDVNGGVGTVVDACQCQMILFTFLLQH